MRLKIHSWFHIKTKRNTLNQAGKNETKRQNKIEKKNEIKK